jgi:DNA-binding response OmpR family regulator
LQKIAVLLVEDDPVLGQALGMSLELESFKVHWARDLRSAGALFFEGNPKLVVLDLGLPDGTGLELLRKIREQKIKTAIIVLTARTDEDTVVQCLQAGANDYVRKPFGYKELHARIQAALNATLKRDQNPSFGGLKIATDQRRAFFADKELPLKRREFDILKYFVEHAESVVGREALLSSLGHDSEVFDRTIDSHVSHIRKKLRESGVSAIRISSVYGIGYRLESDE